MNRMNRISNNSNNNNNNNNSREHTYVPFGNTMPTKRAKGTLKNSTMSIKTFRHYFILSTVTLTVMPRGAGKPNVSQRTVNILIPRNGDSS